MTKKTLTPALDDEAYEVKLISLALQTAEEQMLNGTASSQVITHFLKLGSIRSKIELESLILENQLLEEKIIAQKNNQKVYEMMDEVIAALRNYSYSPPRDIDVDL